MITAERYHDICCGHRVYGHESKCAHLHGHNYRFHFTITGELDTVGRVLDFSVIKSHLCMWLESNWDHKFLLWNEDPWKETLQELDYEGLQLVSFNPTAENICKYFLHDVAPDLLAETGAKLIKIRIEETRKCSASCQLI